MHPYFALLGVTLNYDLNYDYILFNFTDAYLSKWSFHVEMSLASILKGSINIDKPPNDFILIHIK